MANFICAVGCPLEESRRHRGRIARRQPVIDEELRRESRQSERIALTVGHRPKGDERNSAYRGLTGYRRCLHVINDRCLEVDHRKSSHPVKMFYRHFLVSRKKIRICGAQLWSLGSLPYSERVFVPKNS